MFAGVELQRSNNVTTTSGGFLKLPEFYSLSQQDKITWWNRVNHHAVVSCHRQFGFDYNTIEPVTVISVKISDRTWLYKRIKDIHWKQNKYDIGNPMLKKIKERLSESELDALIEADYRSWVNANILESDDILPFEFLLDGSITEWAESRQLKINKECLTVICNQVAAYQ
jgi:hypothetical protein